MGGGCARLLGLIGVGRDLIAWMGACGGLGWKVLGCGWELRDFCRRIFVGGGSLCWMIASAMSAVVPGSSME